MSHLTTLGSARPRFSIPWGPANVVMFSSGILLPWAVTVVGEPLWFLSPGRLGYLPPGHSACWATWELTPPSPCVCLRYLVLRDVNNYLAPTVHVFGLNLSCLMSTVLVGQYLLVSECVRRDVVEAWRSAPPCISTPLSTHIPRS